MKKKLIAYLLISALAATVFVGCGKSEGGDAAPAGDDAASGETVVETQTTPEAEEAASAIDTAAAAAIEAAEQAEIAGTSDAAEAEVAAEEMAGEGDVEEYVEEAVEDTKEEAGAASTEEAAAPAEEGEDLIVDPGTQYEVRFGGNVYATMDQVDSNIIDYVYPGYILQIDERHDDFWYKVTYWIEGAARTGYIKIQ